MKRWLLTAIGGVALVLTLACAPAAQKPAAAPAQEPVAPAGAGEEVAVPLPKLGGSLTVLGPWDGPQLENFKAVMASWSDGTGIKIEFESTKDVDGVLTTRIAEKKPPDVAILSNPASLTTLVNVDKKLKQINLWLDLETFAYGEYYPVPWVAVSSVGSATKPGKPVVPYMYGLAFTAANRSIVWYNPKEFKANGWTTPKTWDEMMALSDKMVAAGKTPWSISADTGWPITDLIENIVLRASGPDVYDQWISHQIKWTDPTVKGAFQRLAQIIGNPKYVRGGNQAAAATKFQDGVLPLYLEKPEASLYFGGDFVQNTIKSQYPKLKAGDDYAFFALPSIKEEFGNPVVASADLMVALADSEQVREFFNYLAKPKTAEAWAKKGYIVPNKGVNFNAAYPDAVSRASAQMLTKDGILRFNAASLMPPTMRDAFYKQAQAFVADPKSIDPVLEALEAVAVEAYKPPAKKP